MQRREHRNVLTGTIAGLALIAVCLMTWPSWSPWSSLAQSQGAAARARSVSAEQTDGLRSTQKPKAPISDGRPESASQNKFSAAEINSSMRARRNQAWAIVEQVWAPVSVAGGKIPAWMTWYEEQDIGPLYRALLSKQTSGGGASTPALVRSNVDAVLKEHPFKDLQTSLISVRLGKTLRQFTFPGMPLLGPKRRPASGVIYYNTAFVRYLLENAERIVNCDPTALAKLNFPGSSQAADLLGIQRSPVQLLPSDPQNRYAL